MKNTKQLRGLLNTLDGELILLKLIFKKLNYQVDKIKADEVFLYEKLQNNADTENFISSLNQLNQKTEILISDIEKFCNHDPESRDNNIRSQGRDLKQQSINTRNQYNLLIMDLESFIFHNPQLQTDINTKVFEETIDKFNRVIKRAENKLEESVKEEIKTEIAAKLNTAISKLKDSLEQALKQQEKLEELKTQSKREALQLISDNEQLIEELHDNIDSISSMVSIASQEFIQAQRAEGLEDYYQIIRMLPSTHEDLPTAESYHKELFEDVTIGYYDECTDFNKTVDKVLSVRKNLKVILEQ